MSGSDQVTRLLSAAGERDAFDRLMPLETGQTSR
jgi:hypothetical protein